MRIRYSDPVLLPQPPDLKNPFVREDGPLSPPSEAAELKDRIRKTNTSKLYAFSFAHMRKVAVPPVEIPKLYRRPRARSFLVGGRQVPFTKDMWAYAKRCLSRRMLDRIHEHVMYD